MLQATIKPIAGFYLGRGGGANLDMSDTLGLNCAPVFRVGSRGEWDMTCTPLPPPVIVLLCASSSLTPRLPRGYTKAEGGLRPRLH